MLTRSRDGDAGACEREDAVLNCVPQGPPQGPPQTVGNGVNADRDIYRTPIPVVPLTWADRLPPGQIRDRALVLGRKRQLDLSDVDTPGLRDGLPVSDQPLQM